MKHWVWLGASGAVSLALLTGCSTAAVGAGALGAMAEAVALNNQGKELRRRAQEQSDIAAFEEAQTPTHVESEASYLSLVARLQKQGMWFASLAHIDALEAQWQPSDRSRILRADALRQVGNLAASTALYEQLLKGRQAARALHGLGLNVAAQGQYEQAVLHLQAAQRLNPTDPGLLSDLGFALLHMPEAIGAGLPLKQAAQLDPANPRIQSNLAVYLVLYGQPTEASQWMAAHQMSSAQRTTVFESAMRIASLHAQRTGAVPAPTAPVGVSSSCSPCLRMEQKLHTAPPT